MQVTNEVMMNLYLVTFPSTNSTMDFINFTINSLRKLTANQLNLAFKVILEK